MASPPTASPKTRSRSASSRASTTRSASSSAAPTVYATRNICGSRCSHACFQRSEVAKNTHTTSRRPKSFNDQFGNVAWMDNDRGRKLVTEEIPAKGSADKADQNAKKNSDKQKARIEHDKALTRVMTAVL